MVKSLNWIIKYSVCLMHFFFLLFFFFTLPYTPVSSPDMVQGVPFFRGGAVPVNSQNYVKETLASCSLDLF